MSSDNSGIISASAKDTASAQVSSVTEANDTTSPNASSLAAGSGWADKASVSTPKALEMLRAIPEQIVNKTTDPAQSSMPLQDAIAVGRFTSWVVAPGPVKAPRNATLAAAKQAAMLQVPNEMPGNITNTHLVSMLCKPVPANLTLPSPVKVVGFSNGDGGVVVITIVFNVIWMTGYWYMWACLPYA